MNTQPATPDIGIHSHALCTVPLFSAQLEGYATRRESLSRLILDLRRQNPGIAASKRRGWHSERDLHLRNDEDIVWLVAQLVPFLRCCLDSLHPDFKKADAVMTSCWANVNERQAWNEPHTHLPSHWSGVFYVSAEEGLNHDDLSDKAGSIEFINPMPLAKAFGSSSSYFLRPRNGLALLFPAHVTHFVHPNLTDATRISIAFNLDIEFPAS